MTTVKINLTRYGPSVVPNGLVDAQNLGYGSTPCLTSLGISTSCPDSRCWMLNTHLPHSLSMRDEPMRTVNKLPNELRAIKKLRPLTALPEPNTFVKNRLAAICLAAARLALGTNAYCQHKSPFTLCVSESSVSPAAKYAMLAKM